MNIGFIRLIIVVGYVVNVELLKIVKRIYPLECLFGEVLPGLLKL